MSDSLDQQIEHARASADALADPEDIENRVILNWMRQHRTFSSAGRSYVLITEPLPLRWRSRAMVFKTAADAKALLRAVSKDQAAMGRLRAALARLGPVNVNGDGVLDRVSEALARRRMLLFRDVKRSPPLGQKTDPAVYSALNGVDGTNVVFSALAEWEGAQRLHAYVPFMRDGKVAGNSGVTIATGFDIGQKSTTELKALGLPAKLRDQLLPFAGHRFKGKTRKQVAALIGKIAPLPTVTKSEADLIDKLIHGVHLRAAVTSWNTARKRGVPAFKDLPANWQTVLFSRTFHQGEGMPNTRIARDFYRAATSGDWQTAIHELEHYPVSEDWYKKRVQKEAAMLRQTVPAAVVAPAPAAGRAAQGPVPLP